MTTQTPKLQYLNQGPHLGYSSWEFCRWEQLAFLSIERNLKGSHWACWKLFARMNLSGQCAVVLYFQLVGVSSVAPAEEPSAASSNQATQTQFATSQAVYTARRHPAYQVFAQTHQPTITVKDSKTLNFGGALKLDVGKPDSIVTTEKNALAARLEIPVEFLTALVQKLSANAQLNGEELAHQFEVAVTDYKYLSERWARYHPPAGGEPMKLQALNCLQAADLEKAWRMFIDIPKPKPPTAVQIISANNGTESR